LRSGAHRLHRGLDAGERRHHHEGGGNARFSRAADQRHPIHPRHANVRKDHVDALLLEDGQRLDAVGRLRHREPLLTEDGAKGMTSIGLVVHDQDPRLGHPRGGYQRFRSLPVCSPGSVNSSCQHERAECTRRAALFRERCVWPGAMFAQRFHEDADTAVRGLARRIHRRREPSRTGYPGGVAESIFEDLKHYVGFGPGDGQALRAMHPHAQPHFPRIAEVFYDQILAHPEARRVLESGESEVGKLKQTLIQWMDGVFLGPWDNAYFERRCRIGRVHVRIGLPQHYMFGAMNVLRRELNDVVNATRRGDVDAARAARVALGRMLDMELAIMLHTYREDLEAQRMAAVSTLTAGLSHEIRNPLNAAGLQLAVLERRVRRLPPAEQTGALEPLLLVRDEIRRLDHLLEDLLQYARPRELERGPVDV